MNVENCRPNVWEPSFAKEYKEIERNQFVYEKRLRESPQLRIKDAWSMADGLFKNFRQKDCYLVKTRPANDTQALFSDTERILDFK